MTSRQLYSNVVRSGSSEEDLDLVHGEQDGKIDDHLQVNWLYKYQRQSEEIALAKSLKLSQVKYFNF